MRTHVRMWFGREGGDSRRVPPTMADYRFLTTWCLDAPIQPVWDAIHASERWPQWWKGVERVTEVQPGDELGVGGIRRYTWRSRLPYQLEFDMRVTRAEPPYFLEG